MRWIPLLIALLAPPLAARADAIPDGGVTAPEVASVLRAAGYPADVIADHAGNPLIHSSTGKVLFHVLFYQCGTELRCASIQFSARSARRSVSPATIAAWNREKRFGRAFQDKWGLAWVAMDVEASRGMTTEALAANITRWIAVLNAFEVFVVS